MPLPVTLANRIGFIVLGLSNNFAYVIMLSAAYDLLKQTDQSSTATQTIINNGTQQKYCNEHSTSTILLADTLPSLTTKIIYPFVLVQLPTAYKAIATALLAAAAFIITGLSTSQLLIFTGVVCASFSSGLGESTYLSNTPLYGDVALSGWSMGTGAAGLLGAAAYALLRMWLSIKVIMIVMLTVPMAMIWAYFLAIKPLAQQSEERDKEAPTGGQLQTMQSTDESINVAHRISEARTYGSKDSVRQAGGSSINGLVETEDASESFNLSQKVLMLPSLAKYFLPLLLVYFAEYFINQGLFELIYYPNINIGSLILDHATQYSWFQVCYQLGVFISRSSLDVITISNIWLMSTLQALNALLFLAHAAKLIHIPSFYLVVVLIIYEGLLGGFTYVNTFYRIKKELPPKRQEFGISTVTMADSLGIVFAALTALPVHDALCKLYT